MGVLLTIMLRTAPFVMSANGNDSTRRETRRLTFVLHVPKVSVGTFINVNQIPPTAPSPPILSSS